MELVGMEIRKSFHGFGVFTGIVQSYDSSSGYFRIQYEDGDSEDVDFNEIRAILKEMGGSSPKLEHCSLKRGRGRPPKKKTRHDDPSTANYARILDFENGWKRSELEDTLGDDREGDLRRRDGRSMTSGKCERLMLSHDDDLGGGRKDSILAPLIKPELPPPSDDLKLDGLNVLDLLSVYSCLRSFSRQLFLSPFKLEDFVAALRCKYANFMIDSIHLCILQALKPHLELLSEEGSESASDCLRYLNWDILDLVTWPVFIVRYLLINGSQMKPGFRLSQLKLLDSEYYEQPSEVKLEILRCLCDVVVEVDAIRSEINRRMESEINVDATNTKTNAAAKRKFSASIDPSAEGLEETDDGNSDECCLCGMDGSLICCDGCPAAFHSRCVGVAKDLLPEGEWYCPECLVGKSDGLTKLSKPSLGAELLGADPHGHLYFGSCDRLLVYVQFFLYACHFLSYLLPYLLSISKT